VLILAPLSASCRYPRPPQPQPPTSGSVFLMFFIIMPACQRGISCARYNKYNSRYLLRFELFLIPGAPCPSRYTIPPPVSLQSQHIFMLAHQLSCRENARTPAPETIRVFLQIQVSSSCWRALRLLCEIQFLRCPSKSAVVFIMPTHQLLRARPTSRGFLQI